MRNIPFDVWTTVPRGAIVDVIELVPCATQEARP
jgi:hypothetical protein